MRGGRKRQREGERIGKALWLGRCCCRSQRRKEEEVG